MRKFALAMIVTLGLATFANAQCPAVCGVQNVTVAVPSAQFVPLFTPAVTTFNVAPLVTPLIAVNRVAVVQPVNAVRVNVAGVRRANVRVRVR